MSPDIVICPLEGKIVPTWEPLLYTNPWTMLAIVIGSRGSLRITYVWGITWDYFAELQGPLQWRRLSSADNLQLSFLSGIASAASPKITPLSMAGPNRHGNIKNWPFGLTWENSSILAQKLPWGWLRPSLGVHPGLPAPCCHSHFLPFPSTCVGPQGTAY